MIGIVLNGLHAPITVNGQSYNGQMPPWKGTLTNKQIADVITYIRSSLGNNASAVTASTGRGVQTLIEVGSVAGRTAIQVRVLLCGRSATIVRRRP